jgi:molybdenum-dependent DNA-binding transcriptional regulator ModE
MLQGAWNMLQGSLKYATRKPEICYKEAWNMLQGCLKYATIIQYNPGKEGTVITVCCFEEN